MMPSSALMISPRSTWLLANVSWSLNAFVGGRYLKTYARGRPRCGFAAASLRSCLPGGVAVARDLLDHRDHFRRVAKPNYL